MLFRSDAVKPYERELREIILPRRLNACEAWKAFGEKLSGCAIPDFSAEALEREYLDAEEKNDTALGRFLHAALAQKSMVTNRIFKSGNLLAGFSVELDKKGFQGIRDFRMLLGEAKGGRK